MTRKHYEAIASQINKLDLTRVNIEHVACMVATALQITNTNFNRQRFIDACMKGH